MRIAETKYDVAIVGGGLAGLSLAIQLARQNHSVVLFEKENYPFHKVCGEYISMEAWNFLENLGVPLSVLDLPRIKTLLLTPPNGKTFATQLPLGGFGISRYKMDHLLAQLAKEAGVHLLEETKVENVVFENDSFSIKYTNALGVQETEATLCCGAYGKRSNLDVKWKRSFIANNNSRINNYVAVKYHVKADWPSSVIGLHNFSGGYCGISQVEENKHCLCYLTTAANLRKSENSILKMEQEILFKNPALKKVFANSEFLLTSPCTISQISFSRKSLVENNLLMLGDAAGMITPLCGNGMSMAMHSSKMAANIIGLFLNKRIDRAALEVSYIKQWEKQFSVRMRAGRALQSFFGSVFLSHLFVSVFKAFPLLARPVIRRTHGTAF